MSLLPKPIDAPVPRTKNVKTIATFYAGVLAVFAIAQLFTFENFLELFVSFDFPWGRPFAYFSAALLVTAEVFALPFLLRMSLSKAFRWMSMAFGILAAVIWVKVSLWLVIFDSPVDTVGFLGTAVNVMPGWWAVFVSVALGILAIWSVWGLWPGKRKK